MNFKFLLAGMFALAAATTQAANVACVGNSITYGYGLSSSEYSYPTRLQELLGSDYTVTNFGVSSMTFATYGNQSYWSTDRFTAAMNSNPNTVVVELGTNDSKFFMGNYADQGIYNWAYGQVSKADLQRDYRALIDTFAHLSTNPEIFATLQPYSNNVSWTITDTAIVNVINPIIFDAAVEKGVNIIDLHTLFHTPSWYLNDSVHPNEDGAYELAKIIYNHISHAKPVISAVGSILTVDAGYGFYWYKDGSLISGANAQFYNATEKGSYKALVKIDAATDSYLLTDAVEVDGSGSVDIDFDCVKIDTTLSAECSEAEGLFYSAPSIEYSDMLGNKYTALATRNDGKTMTDVFPWGENEVTWSITMAGKQYTCPQTITVINSIPQIAECPELKDVIVTSDTASVIDGAVFGNPLAIMGCSDSVTGTPTREDGKALNEAFPIDTTMVTWTYTLNDNILSCKQNVIVVASPSTCVAKTTSNVSLSYENGYLYVGDNGYELLTVDVYDVQGRLISTKEFVGGSNRVALGLKSGTYIVILKDKDNKVANLKIKE